MSSKKIYIVNRRYLLLLVAPTFIIFLWISILIERTNPIGIDTWVFSGFIMGVPFIFSILYIIYIFKAKIILESESILIEGFFSKKVSPLQDVIDVLPAGSSSVIKFKDKKPWIISSALLSQKACREILERVLKIRYESANGNHN